MPCYLLYGEDDYRSRRKLAAIKARYYDSNMGDINITHLDGENLNLDKIKQSIFPPPFLADKRLIIIKDFISKGKKEEQEKLFKTIDSVPEHSIVVFYENKISDQKSVLFNKLNKKNQSEKFDLLKGRPLFLWAENEIKEKGGRIESSALEKLIELSGPDLWRLSMEIEKLIAFCGSETIEKKDVSFLIKEEVHPKIFALIDAVAGNRTKEAFSLLEKLISLGENENYILSMITFQFRNLLIVKDLGQRHKPLSLAKLHPFVLSKTVSLAQNFEFESLKNIYGDLLETDYQIKTGKMPPRLALDLLISQINNEQHH